MSLVRRPVPGLLASLRLLLAVPAVLPGREGAVLHWPQEAARQEGSGRPLALPASPSVQAVLPGRTGLGGHVEQLRGRRLRLPGLVDVQRGGGAELDRSVAAARRPPGQHEARHLLIPGAAAARPEDALTGPARLVPALTVDLHLAPLPLLRVCTATATATAAAVAAAAPLNTAPTVHRLLPGAPDDVLQLLLAAVVVIVVQTARQGWQ